MGSGYNITIQLKIQHKRWIKIMHKIVTQKLTIYTLIFILSSNMTILVHKILPYCLDLRSINGPCSRYLQTCIANGKYSQQVRSKWHIRCTCQLYYNNIVDENSILVSERLTKLPPQKGCLLAKGFHSCNYMYLNVDECCIVQIYIV